MPKMTDQAQTGKKAAVYKKSRAKRETEIAAMQAEAAQEDNVTETVSTAPVSVVPPRRVGRPPSDKTDKINIVMEPMLRRQLKTYCAMYDRTAADVIGELVRDLVTRAGITDLPSLPDA